MGNCNDLSRVFIPSMARNNKLYRIGHGYFELDVPSKALTNDSLIRGSRIWCRGPTRVAFLSRVGYSK